MPHFPQEKCFFLQLFILAPVWLVLCPTHMTFQQGLRWQQLQSLSNCPTPSTCPWWRALGSDEVGDKSVPLQGHLQHVDIRGPLKELEGKGLVRENTAKVAAESFGTQPPLYILCPTAHSSYCFYTNLFACHQRQWKPTAHYDVGALAPGQFLHAQWALHCSTSLFHVSAGCTCNLALTEANKRGRHPKMHNAVSITEEVRCTMLALPPNDASPHGPLSYSLKCWILAHCQEEAVGLKTTGIYLLCEWMGVGGAANITY